MGIVPGIEVLCLYTIRSSGRSSISGHGQGLWDAALPAGLRHLGQVNLDEMGGKRECVCVWVWGGSIASLKKGLVELRLLDLSQTNAHANGTQFRQNPVHSAWLPTSMAKPHTSNYTSSQECLAGRVHSCMCQNNARVRIPYRPSYHLYRPAPPTTYR